MANLSEYLAKHKEEQLEELKDFLRIPSISADPQYKNDVRNAAEWLSGQLKSIGVESQIYETKGHPIVYGEYFIGEDKPTVLFYGHYDVQPPDPLELWETEPFDPVIRTTDIHPQGAIFARGACDDKEQLYMQVKAAQALIANKMLECNLKFIYEGEEEVGSDNLDQFCIDHQELLRNDVI